MRGRRQLSAGSDERKGAEAGLGDAELLRRTSAVEIGSGAQKAC